MAVDPVAPPADLKARTIARATGQPQALHRETPAASTTNTIVHTHRSSIIPRGSLGWLAAAAGIAVAIGAGIYSWSLRSEIHAVQQFADEASTSADHLRAQLLTVRQDNAKLTQTLGILGAPDVVRVDLKGQGDTAATAQVYWSASRGLLLMNAANMPALDASRVFELWALPPGAGAAPLAAGLFRVDAVGLVTIVAPPSSLFPAADAFAITIEPSTGSTQPTMPIVLVGKTKKI
jgi:hypothetical protein